MAIWFKKTDKLHEFMHDGHILANDDHLLYDGHQNIAYNGQYV